MFPLRHGETVTRLRRQMVLDPYSEEETLGSWEDAAELQLVGVAIGPSSATELTTEDRQQVITVMALYGAQGLDVLPDDRIRARSGLWEVRGEEQAWTNPFTGWSPGSEWQLRKVVG